MRKEPFTTGSYVHVIQRGVRKLAIVRDEIDRIRFLKLLCYMNDEYSSENWIREIKYLEPFDRPRNWPPKSPLVKILAFCLLDNHFHLLLREIKDGGISMFMKKIGNSMTGHFNKKYKTVGRLFQGSYKARTVKSDRHLQYLAAYILVKNPFELFPGGIQNAKQHFDDAYTFACNYDFCSLGSFLNIKKSQFIDLDIYDDFFKDNETFKAFAKDVIEGRVTEV